MTRRAEMRKKYPKVSIITVNFNRKKFLKKLYDSVFRLNYPKIRLEVILVDNVSTDNSVEFVEKHYPKVKIIKNDINNYCKAVNLGIEASRAKYLALVNNDTKLDKNWLVELIGVITKDKRIAAVGSKILDMKGRIQNAAQYELPNFYWGERGAGQSAKRYNTVEEVCSLCGAAVLYRKDMLFEVGLFDEDFVIYGEDVDMSLRLRQRGYKLVFVPTSIIHHKFHGTASEELNRYYIERNRLLFLAKHYPHKLSSSLLGSGYFTAKKSIYSSGKIYSIFPEIIMKLIKTHSLDIANEVVSELFREITKILNYENDLLIKKFNEMADDQREKNEDNVQKSSQIVNLRTELDNLSNKLRRRMDEILLKDGEIIEKEHQIVNLRTELDNLSNQLRRRMDEILLKDGEIIEKEHQIVNLRTELDNLSNKLKSLTDAASRQLKIISNKEKDIYYFKEELEMIKGQLRRRMDEILLKDGEIIEKENQIVNLRTELDNLSNQLRRRMDEILLKDVRITNIKSELDNLANQLHQRMDEILLKDGEIINLKDELGRIYNSKGYRFFLRPFWNMPKCLNIVKRKLTSLFWLAITIMLTPVILFLSLCFLLEYVSWFILKPVLKRVAPQRKIKSIKDRKISMVIPNYNGINCLRECLPSIFSAEVFADGQNEVLIVDDGSTDGSIDFIRSHFPQVHLIQNKRNRGFGFTCNRGVKAASNETIVLINNDIILTKDFIKPLISHLQKEDVFVTTPKLYAWDKKTFIWGMHIGGFEEGYIRLWNESETGNGERISQLAPTIFAIGGAMVFRKSDFLWLGGFDSIYRPNCWEDIDLSYRAWKRGLKVLYEPKSLMYHKGRATLTYERPKEIKNELLFTWKNITDADILKNHLNLLPWNLYRNRMNFLRGFLWALNYLPQTMFHRFLDRRYAKTQDKKIFNQCMLYYKNFMLRGFRHLQDSEKKNVLIITPFIPFPLNSGGKIRIYTLAKLLNNKFDISLLTLINHEDEINYIPELKKVFKEVYAVFPKTQIESKFYPQRYKYAHSHILIDKLNEIQKNQPLDLIQIESNELLYLADYIKYIPIIYTEHDSSVLFFKNSYYQIKEGTVISNFFDYLKRVRFHYSSYKKLDRIILLSREDEQILQTFFPKTNFSFIPTGVDIRHFSFVHSDRPKSKRLIYVGHYPHYPNEDAVIYFIKKIFPRIRKKIPEAEFLIVGSGLTEKIKRISNQPNIRLIPDIEDVWPYLRESAIFVNPIRISRGIKGKVLEAMATGLPVVSTKIGASGISARDRKQILLADTPSVFAQAVIELIEDDKLYSEIARNARHLVENRYDWQEISQFLIQVYEQTINFLAPTLTQEAVSFDKIIDLSNQIVEDAIQQKKFHFGSEYGPEELHIELTYRCDSQCIMCDLWDYQKRFPEEKREITLDEIKHFVEESTHLKKIKTVVLSGGEPFLCKELREICGYFIRKFPSISLGILTNGLETKTIIDTTKQILDKYKPKYLWLGSSLDGIGETHDRIRSKRGAFSSLEKTIQACKREGINITLTFTISTYNFDQLIPAKKFADSYGLEFYIQFAVPKEIRERSVFNFTASQLSKIETDLYTIMQAEIRDKNYKNLLQTLRGDSYQGLVTKLYYLSHLVRHQKSPKRYFRKCVSGTRFAMLSPFGDLYFCPGLKYGSIGNIREEKFDNLWTSKKAESIREFVAQELCHCWLVCVVFPVIDEARASIKAPGDSQTLKLTLKSEEKEEKRIEFSKKNGYLLKENSDLNEQEYLSGKTSLKSTPRGIGIGAHWRCNANCIFCLGGYPRFFDLRTYKQFFEKRLFQILSKAEFINLCGFGELLRMPHCEEFLDYINQTLPFSNKILTTNGTPLSKTINQKLTEGKYSLQISLHASEKRLHQMLTRIEAFDRIIEQTQNLLSIRKSHQYPSVSLIFIINTLNIENLPEFVEFAAKLGVNSVIANYMTVYTPAQLKLSCFFKQEIANKMFGEAEKRAARFGLSLSLPPKFGGNGSKHIRCPEPWQYLYVENEGSILPCCYAGAHIGYLYRDEFQEVWNGEFYKNLRRSLVEGEGFSWCRYCYKNKASNVNDIHSHISFRPDLQQKIINGNNLK